MCRLIIRKVRVLFFLVFFPVLLPADRRGNKPFFPVIISERYKWFYAECDWSISYFSSYQQRRVFLSSGDLSRRCHLCHGSCKSRKRGTSRRPPSSRNKTVGNLFLLPSFPLALIFSRHSVNLLFCQSLLLVLIELPFAARLCAEWSNKKPPSYSNDTSLIDMTAIFTDYLIYSFWRFPQFRRSTNKAK